MESEYKRTLAVAEKALKNIKHNEIPAYPATYEVWYAHLTGRNKELSKEIEAIYKKYGRVSASQIHNLYNTFLSKSLADDKIDRMGEELSDEVDNLLKVVSQSDVLTRDFGSTLERAATDLEAELDQESLLKIIRRVALETSAIQQRNNELEMQLDAAKENLLQLQKTIDEVREESIMDQLTMIGNRKHFDRSLDQAIGQCKESGKPLCLILADIDYFKKFNDTWGHQAGDQVLRLVALAIKGNVKTKDVPCRYGGEEFAIILPDTTLDQAHAVAERIRKTVAKRDIVKRSTGENLGKITISSGISILKPNDLMAALIRRADLCLYAAKNAGRDQVILETDKVMRDVA